ncbi:MAG: selenide, water dikinase SelD [Henriciella sp.]
MNRPIPITRDLVLLGGGHAHALVLKKWAMTPLPGAQVTLVNPDVKAPYTGMLPGFVAGHYTRADLDIDLVRLARQAGARLIVDEAIGIDTEQKRVHLKGRPELAYDTLSIDIGITSKRPELSQLEQPVIKAKPLALFAKQWEALLDHSLNKREAPQIVLIGAGVAGVELALSMVHRLAALDVEGAHLTLVEMRAEPLADVNAMAKRDLLRALEQAGVKIICNATVAAIGANSVTLSAGQQVIPASFVLSTAGAQPHAWLSDTGLTLENGFIAVNKQLQTHSHDDVFAVGDCAHLSHAPRPKAGVFAVRQAPVLFQNLRASLTGGDLRAYNPQASYLKLVSKGGKSAVSDKWGIGLSGPWIWRFKNRIDQAFMEQFREPTEMPRQDRPALAATGVETLLERTENQCGGCGAKVAQTALKSGLASTASKAVSEGGPFDFDDAAVLRNGDRMQVLSTDHLRAFNFDAFTLAQVAAVHALGDVWAMGGHPKTVLSHIILPPLSAAKQAEMIREITIAAEAVFKTCGARIVGGHTSSGAELTIGFSILGDLAAQPIRLKSAKSGDVLVLTKPIGTGVVLAAEMQQRVDGEDYQAALNSMCRLQDKASALLAHSATAMTDVTGFGLAGHMLNIADASEVGLRLNLSAVPILSGAEALAREGVRSTLWPENNSRRDRLSIPPSPRLDLLFDPQTCGGLLACIPADQIDHLAAQFEDADEPIWRIGEVVEGSGIVGE